MALASSFNAYHKICKFRFANIPDTLLQPVILDFFNVGTFVLRNVLKNNACKPLPAHSLVLIREWKNAREMETTPFCGGVGGGYIQVLFEREPFLSSSRRT